MNQNFPYSVMEATAEMVKDPVKKDGDKLVMQLNVTVKANAQKFDEFRKAIEPTLEKLALSKRTMNLKMEKYVEEYHIVDPPESIMNKNTTTPIFVYLNTTRNSSVTFSGWDGYELPYKNAILFAAYCSIAPVVEISLTDLEGSIIAMERIGCYVESYHAVVPYNCTNQFAGYWTGGNLKTSMGGGCMTRLEKGTIPFSQYRVQNFCIAPFFASPREHANDNAKFISQVNLGTRLTLEPNELKSIKTIKCTVLSQNPVMNEYYRKLPETLENWQPEE